MRLIRVHRHAYGPRVYVLGRRVHHGSAGAIGVASYLASYRVSYLASYRSYPAARALVALGAIALWHDRADFPFRDIDNHEPIGAIR